ncbi:MAG: energy transducer TonB [Opitutae bacterium]|nr:energy transducer TonB [Opitutae bacterium]
MKKLIALCLLGAVALAETPEEFPVNALDEPPRPKHQEPPIYPFSMRRAGVEGRVTVEFIVNKEGRIADAFILKSNNPWFERPALDAIMKWTFTPAKKDGRPVFTRCQIDMPFTLQGGGSQFWAVPDKLKHPEALPEALRWDIPPEVLNTVFPVFPFEEAVKETRGKVKITFIVGTDGNVIAAKAVEASHPELARAALAAIDAWEFRPARKKDGTRCGAALAIEYEFDLRSGDVPVDDSALGILRQLRKNRAAKFTSANELDAPLKPLSRRRPVYPSALHKAGQDGEALIEFFIDERGDAQLPRVVSAANPEFGYAAAQAVATWRFAPPRKGGKSVVTRAQVPLRFHLTDPSAHHGQEPVP